MEPTTIRINEFRIATDDIRNAKDGDELHDRFIVYKTGNTIEIEDIEYETIDKVTI